jgi:hypothetical protein
MEADQSRRKCVCVAVYVNVPRCDHEREKDVKSMALQAAISLLAEGQAPNH